MTFEEKQRMNLGQTVAELGNRLDTLTGWTLALDNTTTDGLDYQEIVVTNPFGEFIRIYLNSRKFTFEYGADYDLVNGNWVDRYNHDLRSDRGYMTPIHNDDWRARHSDEVRCWFEYVDRGFLMYVERLEGDGRDGEMFMGFSEVSQVWQYTVADSRESYMAWCYGATRSDQWGDVSPNNTNRQRWNHMGEGGHSGNTFDGYGILNPDADWDNFVVVPTLQASTRFRNTTNTDSIIGTHDLWLNDRSTYNTAHMDTVSDGAGNTYKILKAYTMDLAMRME